MALTATAIVVSGSGRNPAVDPQLTAAAAQMQRVLGVIPQRGITLGNPSAAITVTEFGDLQCPYCGAYALTMFPGLTDYVRAGEVRMVFRPVAFVGPDSFKAGRAAIAAGEQDKLWGFVDAFYNNQGYENSGYVTNAFLRRVGRLVPGLRVNEMMAEMRSRAVREQIGGDADLARAERVHATPTFLVQAPGHDPLRVVGFETLKAAIQAEFGPRTSAPASRK